MTTTLNSRGDVEAECKRLGVILCHHGDKRSKTNIGAWANLFQPGFTERVWMTLYPRILAPTTAKNYFDDWKIVCHELVHWRRQRDAGLFKWLVKYCLSHRFRFEEEARASLEDIRLGRARQSWIVESMVEFYGIDTIPRAEMHRWFDEHR